MAEVCHHQSCCTTGYFGLNTVAAEDDMTSFSPVELPDLGSGQLTTRQEGASA